MTRPATSQGNVAVPIGDSGFSVTGHAGLQLRPVLDAT